MRTVEAGVTTVRDLGADQYMDIAMRDLINRGEMIGPRMFVCGYGLYITADHISAKRVCRPRRHSRWRSGSAARRAPTKSPAGADVIKMYGSTGTDDDVTASRPTPSRK